MYTILKIFAVILIALVGGSIPAWLVYRKERKARIKSEKALEAEKKNTEREMDELEKLRQK